MDLVRLETASSHALDPTQVAATSFLANAPKKFDAATTLARIWEAFVIRKLAALLLTASLSIVEAEAVVLEVVDMLMVLIATAVSTRAASNHAQVH